MEETIVFKLNRIIAALVDGLLVFLAFAAFFTYPFIELLLEINGGGVSQGTIVLLSLCSIAGLGAGIFYLFITSLIFKGATLGMKMLHLSFSRNDGSIPRAVTMFIRTTLTMLTVVLSLGLSIIADLVCLLLNEQGKNFHDIFSNMKVVTDYGY